ncbi:MAG: MFS transporter [Solirubrobacteraceae bacterium]
MLRRFSRASDEAALFAIVAEGFLSRLSFGVINVALPLYAHRKLGMSFTEVGFLISLNTLVAIVLKPLLGGLADRVGLKRSLNVAVVLRSIVTLLLAIAAVPWQVFAARSVHGVSIGIRDPVVGAMIAEHGGKKRVAQSFAWYQTAKSVAGNAGKALAPLLLLASAGNFTFVYLAACALSALPIIVVVGFIREPPRESRVSVVQMSVSQAKAARAEKAAAPVSRETLASFMGLGFLVSATANMLSGLFPLIVTEYAGLSDGVLSMLYIVGTAAAFTGPIFGWLSDHVGNKIVLSIRSTANIMSSVLYIVAPSVAGVAVGKALDDTGKAAFKPAWGSMMAQLSSMDRQRRARMFGYMTSGEDAGEIVAPIFAGFLATGWGIPVMLGGRIVLAAATEVYTVVVSHKYLDEEAPGPRSFRMRLALPVRAALSMALGFGGGWMVSDVQHSAQAHTRAAAQRAQASQAASHGRACRHDATVKAVRRQPRGGC